MEQLFSPDIYKWIVLPLAIFLARLIGETIGTLRIMFLSKGNRIIAPILGFIEVLIWIVLIGQIMQNLENALCYVAYAAGFAVGSSIGMSIENKLALGISLIHVITRKKTVQLEKSLQAKNYGFTKVAGKDIDGVENVLFIIVKKSELENVIQIIKQFNPQAFFSIEDIRKVNEGKYPLKGKSSWQRYNFGLLPGVLLGKKRILSPEVEPVEEKNNL